MQPSGAAAPFPTPDPRGRLTPLVLGSAWFFMLEHPRARRQHVPAPTHLAAECLFPWAAVYPALALRPAAAVV